MSPAKEATGDVQEGCDRDEQARSEQSQAAQETGDECQEKKAFKETELFKILAGRLTVETLGKVQELITGGADLNARGLFQETYLHVLMAPREDGIVKDEPTQTTQTDGEIHKQTDRDTTNIDDLEAESRIISSLVYQLAAAGMSMNTKDQEGNTGLHIAAINDQPPNVIAAMIRVGLDPSLLNYADEDAMAMVEAPATKEALTYYEHGLWKAGTENNLKKTKKLLDAWCKIDITDKNDETLLTVVTDNEHFDIVAALKSKQLTNRLIHACLAGDADSVKKLLKNEVDVNVVDQGHFTIDGILQPMPLLGETVLLGRHPCAKLLLKQGADVNVMVEVTNNNNIPLYYYLLRKCNPVPVDVFKLILKKADFSLIQNEHYSLLLYAWSKRLDAQLVSIMVARGVFLGLTDNSGYTLRDVIVRDTCTLAQEERNQALYFVDEHVLDMAMEGRVDELKALAASGYSYILVTNRKGKTINKIAKKEKKSDVVKFLDDLPKHRKAGYGVYTSILKGNLAEVRDNMNETLSKSCNTAGRSPLHLAVLYERRFIIKWLLKQYPQDVNAIDQMKRTALHYAYMIPDGQDMVELLIQANVDQNVKDNEGRVASDYKSKGDKRTLQNERIRPCGVDTLTLDRYLNIRDLVKAGNTERALEVIDSIVEFPVGELMEVGSRFPQLHYEDLLFLCVRHKQEDTAIALIKAGMLYHHTEQFERPDGQTETLSLRDAASEKECHKLVQFLDEYKPETDERDREAQMAFKAAMAVADGNRGSSGKSGRSDDSDVTLPDHLQGADTSEPGPSDPAKPSPDAKNSSTCTIL